jgi:hypothetical protein
MSSDEDTVNSYESEEEIVEAPKKRGKKTKDPNKPKRNMSAFFLYSNEHRARIKEENPGVKFGQVVSTGFCTLLCHCSLFGWYREL